MGVDKWHKTLGELRSMALALPGARGLFSQMQDALCHVIDKRVTLSPGVYDALDDFKWLAEDVANRPTRMYELFPLHPTVDGYHDARDICAEAWCSQDPRPHQEHCRHSLALRGPPPTPQGRTP